MTLPAGVPPGARADVVIWRTAQDKAVPLGLAAMHDRRGGIGLDSACKAVFGIARLPLLPARLRSPEPPATPPARAPHYLAFTGGFAIMAA